MTPHYEVVDARGQLVGSVKHGTEGQARSLLNALLACGTAGLSVAIVTERLVMQREVTRLPLQKAA